MMLRFALALLICLGSGACDRHEEVHSDRAPGPVQLPEIGDRMPEAAQELLAQAGSYTLFTLHPYPHEEEGAPGEQGGLHGYRILGQSGIAVETARALLASLYRDALANQDGRVAACFDPRHGLRAEQDGRRVDLVICFECLQVHVHGPEEGARPTMLIMGEAAGNWNRSCRVHGLTVHGGA